MSENEQSNERPIAVDGIQVDAIEVIIVPNISIAPPRGHKNHPVPIMLQAGIPLYARKESTMTKKSNKFSICRLMSDPDIGLSQGLWQDFFMSPAPTLLFRADGIPYTPADHRLLDEFEEAMLGNGPRQVTPHDWISFANTCRGERVSSQWRPPQCFFPDDQYTKPPRLAPLISDDSMRTLYLGGDSTHLCTPKGLAQTGRAHGVRVHGEKLEAVQVPLSGASVPVSIAEMVGLPVRARLLRTKPRESRSLFRMTRLMKHPVGGKLPKNWEEPCMMNGFWPTHVFRSDGVPFTVYDFFVIDKFCTSVHRCKPNDISASLWEEWIKEYLRRHDDEGVSIAESVLLAETNFRREGVCKWKDSSLVLNSMGRLVLWPKRRASKSAALA